MIDPQNFGSFLAQLRKEHNMTQKELAEKLFVSDKAVSKWERGAGMPNITLLTSLAEALGVTVTELLECRRIENADPMDTEQVEALVKKTIQLSEADRQQSAQQKKRHGTALFICLAIACLETVVVFLLLPAIELSGIFLTAELMAAIFGFLFCFVIKETLPAYYDENKIGVYHQGALRMNMPGVSLNNSNWPHIVRTIRLWAMCTLVGFPLFYLLFTALCPPSLEIIRQYGPLILFLTSLFLPIYLVGKKYE